MKLFTPKGIPEEGREERKKEMCLLSVNGGIGQFDYHFILDASVGSLQQESVGVCIFKIEIPLGNALRFSSHF